MQTIGFHTTQVQSDRLNNISINNVDSVKHISQNSLKEINWLRHLKKASVSVNDITDKDITRQKHINYTCYYVLLKNKVLLVFSFKQTLLYFFKFCPILKPTNHVFAVG